MRFSVNLLILIVGFFAVGTFLSAYGTASLSANGIARDLLGLEIREPQLLATRYYARNRTSGFFQRSASPASRRVAVSSPHRTATSHPQR